MHSTIRSNPKRFLITVVLFAFCLRILFVIAIGTYRVSAEDDHFGFGWEMGRVARSLADGRGFSSPLPVPSGPTAVVGPIYPMMLAIIFKAFGIYSTGSAIAARVLQSVFSSATCIFIYLCGRDTLGERSGRLAAAIWAIFPLNIFFTVMRVWETSLTAMLLVALFWMLLSSRDSLSVAQWAATGALVGIAALVSTSLVVLVIPFGISALWRNGLRIVMPVLIGGLSCILVVSPWLVRNYIQFHKLMLRSNFPLEFRIGNNELSYGQKIESFHPSNNAAVNQHWVEVGEQRFIEEERDSNSQFLSHHAKRFVLSTVNRIVNYWSGAWVKPISSFPNNWLVVFGTSILSGLGFAGLWRLFWSGSSAAKMYLGTLVSYPIVYCITTTQPRFYHAITPLLLLLGAYWIQCCWDRTAISVVTSRHNNRSLANTIAN